MAVRTVYCRARVTAVAHDVLVALPSVVVALSIVHALGHYDYCCNYCGLPRM